MRYQVFIPDAMKAQLRAMPEAARQEIGYKLFLLQEDLLGDIKKLKGSKKQYRLRAGNYRVLFELEADKITVYDFGHRKDIYK
jgi:mRNA-degrading endonuclease RelE of RelBE toxin-antitoxin system